jgi:hypothetical protein
MRVFNNLHSTNNSLAIFIKYSVVGTGPSVPKGFPRRMDTNTVAQIASHTLGDFVRPKERDEYFQLVAALRARLKPQSALEEVFAAEIIGATWRLHRCALVEGRMAETSSSLDPMEDDSASRLQIALDRSRAQAHNILRRSIAELRRLQTERSVRLEVFRPDDTSVADLTDYREVAKFLNNHDRGKLLARRLEGIDTIAPAQELGSICKTPRNAPCPCGSGLKHKRCCGKSAPPVLQHAA